MTHRRSAINCSPSSQTGAVLIVGLIMLLLMTVVGLAAIRGSGMQELMAGNTRDRNLAFQAAEAGLRVGEAIDTDTAAYDGTDGTFPDLNQFGMTPQRPARWTAVDWATHGANSGLDFSPSVPNPPQYVVERVVLPVGAVERAEGSGLSVNASGSGLNLPEPEFFRVSGRGTGGTTNTEVVLQTMVKKIEVTN
jgi:type IV pilus assembly protein PilX